MAEIELTLQEAADLLGVHYMTAYRYVRLGLLHASKPSGTWRVARADLDAFQVSNSITTTVGGLGNGSGESGRRRAPWAERLQSRLIAGDSRGAWGVIEAALAAGADLDEIYIDVIGPAMSAIGADWESGQLDISLEHRATGIAMRLIGRLGPRFVRRGRTRGAVVVGAPVGEFHSLPVAMLADLVRGGGWDVSDLGADVPDASLVHAVGSIADLIAVGLSVTNPGCLDSARSACSALRQAYPDLLLIVGGSAVDGEDTAMLLGAHGYAPDGRHFIELLETRRAELRGGSGDRQAMLSDG